MTASVLVVGVAILRGDRVLAARRAGGRDAGWEFPGGKVEAGETPEGAAVREIAEELGCEVDVLGWLAGVVTIREGLELRVALAELRAGEPLPRAGDHDAIRWLARSDLDAVGWLDADRPFVEELAAQGLRRPD